MNEKVYILLPVHNRKDITANFIYSLQAQMFQNYHLLLIDDGSTDGTEKLVRDQIPSKKLSVIKGDGNLWWAGALQKGLDCLNTMHLCSNDVVLMINDDVSFGEEFLLEGVKYLRKHPNSMFLAQFCDANSSEPVETGIYADLRKIKFTVAESADQVNCLSTRGLFTTWGVVQHVGGFYPVLLPHYYSDYEYTIRAGRKGVNLKTTPGIHLLPSLKETGYRDGNEQGRWTVKNIFSKKAAFNPLYGSAFIVLACRWWNIPYGLIKVWAVAIFKLFGVVWARK